jgi:hypothetical protein
MRLAVLIALNLLQWNVNSNAALNLATKVKCHHPTLSHWNPRGSALALSDSNPETAVEEAMQLLAKAKAIRESLVSSSDDSISALPPPNVSGPLQIGKSPSEFSLPSQSLDDNCCYRLYLDIGREPGTWMDPRWGASGRRVEFTVDVSFVGLVEDVVSSDEQGLASDDIAACLMKCVTSKSSLSPIYALDLAPYARLRGGFDKMAINNGGFCIESSSSASKSSSSTLRFCISVDGTTDGDISIPQGYLCFALPYFGLQIVENSTLVMNLSSKEGTVTVKQMGWHTGWWREESRILGLFRAVSLYTAQNRYKV